MPASRTTESPRHARRRLSRRVHRAVLATLGVAGLMLVGIGAIELRSDPRPAQQAASGTLTRSSSAASTPTPGAASTGRPAPTITPQYLSIPAIGLHTTLQMLGLNAAGALNPPTNTVQAGWYTGSSVPGEPGPAVLAGHVDTYQGPAVFFRLRDLKPGDTITVTLSDGKSIAFEVTGIEVYAKDAFPSAAVYGARPDPELRLITCGGTFDYTTRSYLDNVVVSARLVPGS